MPRVVFFSFSEKKCYCSRVIRYLMIKRDFIIDQFSIPKKFMFWIHQHITKPIQGFEHKTNEDGTAYSRTQQLQETRRQAIEIVHYFMKRGKSEPEIFEVLYSFKR